MSPPLVVSLTLTLSLLGSPPLTQWLSLSYILPCSHLLSSVSLTSATDLVDLLSNTRVVASLTHSPAHVLAASLSLLPPLTLVLSHTVTLVLISLTHFPSVSHLMLSLTCCVSIATLLSLPLACRLSLLLTRSLSHALPHSDTHSLVFSPSRVGCLSLFL